MKNRIPGRKGMMAAGILAALTILFSPAFEQETTRLISEASAKAERTPETEKQILAVSSDAMTSSQAVEVESANPFVIQEIITEGVRHSVHELSCIQLPASVVTTLLRSVISPQAP